MVVSGRPGENRIQPNQILAYGCSTAFIRAEVEVLMKRIEGLMVAVLAGALVLAVPSFAQSRGGHAGGGFSHGAGAQHFSGHSYYGPARGFSSGGRNFEGRGFEHRGFNQGYFRGNAWGVGVYPGYAYPYGYSSPYYYDPNYAVPPYYAAPAPAPVCSPNGGYYDANGNWVPDPNCQGSPGVAPTPYGY
jgi:hypothetical protein